MNEQERQRLLGVANQQAPEVVQGASPSSTSAGMTQADADRLRGVATDIQDDSWGTWFKDAAIGATQGASYDWLDDALAAMGVEDYDYAQEIAMQRNPYAYLGGNIAGGIAADATLYAAAGSVVPGIGTAGGALTGAARGAVRGANTFNKMKQLGTRTGKFAGIGAAHGAVAGAGAADDYGQTRGEGAKEGALYGAAFGGAIPLGGAALGGIGQAAGGTVRGIANTGMFKKAVVDDQINTLLTFQKNPQATSSSVVASISDVANRADEIAQANVDKLYNGVRAAKPHIDLRPARSQASSLVERYVDLGKPDVARQLQRVFGKLEDVGFNDAIYLRKQLYKMRGDLQPDDFDKLVKGLTLQIERGTRKAGVANKWLEAEKGFKEYKDSFTTGYFAKAMKDQGLASDDVEKSLRSGAVVDKFNNYNKTLTQMKSQGLVDEAISIQDDIESIVIDKLVKDPKFLAKMTMDKEGMDAILFGNKPLIELFKDTANAQKDTNGNFVSKGLDLAGNAVGSSKTIGGLVSRVGIYGATGPGGILIDLAALLGEGVVGQALKNKKILNLVKRLQKAKDVTEVERLNRQIRREAIVGGIMLGGVVSSI